MIGARQAKTMVVGIAAAMLLIGAAVSGAAEPARLRFDGVKPVPPLATTRPSAEDRKEIDASLAALDAQIAALGKAVAAFPAQQKTEGTRLLADVTIYHKAVAFPLMLEETVDPRAAKRTLAIGLERAKQLAAGNAPWAGQSGVRGYVSKIDGSVQPYILTIPAGYKPGDSKKWPIEYNSHGRSETLTELAFLAGGASTQPTNAGAAAGTVGGERFVVHLYGRYCNASKFAGEIDLLEVMQDVESRYPIDPNRRLVMGFSMGGASTWHLAVHYPDLWAAASPGAGFAETKLYQKLTPAQIDAVPWYQQKLWHLYDAPDYVLNLSNLPMIAYAGEIDPQKQSSDVMIAAAEKEDVHIDRIIGPNTAHAYEKGAKAELDKQLAALLEKGRDPMPAKIRFETWALRYNQTAWLRIEGMQRQWERATIEAEQSRDHITIKTQNVSSLSLRMAPGSFAANVVLTIDGSIVRRFGGEDRDFWTVPIDKSESGWSGRREMPIKTLTTPRKSHGMQGPIDDAFMDSFVIVKPTGTPANDKVGAWANAEADHAIDQWRRMFRGEPRVMDDVRVARALTWFYSRDNRLLDKAAQEEANREYADAKMLHDCNLILFGDPASSKAIAKVLGPKDDRWGRLIGVPINWTTSDIEIGERKFAADHHALVMIYPNPLNPSKYIVLNSGFTFREGDYLTNAQMVPKLPDYAVVDVSQPVTAHAPGGIAAAGFFGEKWELQPNDGKP